MSEKYFPNSIYISVSNNKTPIKIRESSGFIEDELHDLIAYCKLFKSKAKIYKRTLKDEIKNLEFDHINLGIDHANNIFPIINIDGTKYVLKNGAISNEIIIKLLIENGIQTDGSLAGPFRMYSHHVGGALRLMHRSDPLWEGLSKKDDIREKPFGSKDLKIGHVYRQLSKYGSYNFLYLGRVREPSTKKLSYSFVLFDNFDDHNNQNCDPNADATYMKVLNKMSKFFSYEDEPLKYRYKRSDSDSITITPSVPSHLVLDDGKIELEKLSTDDRIISEDTIENLIQSTVDEQWIEYFQRVEIAKAMGETKIDSWSKRPKFVWQEPQPPSWMDPSRRMK